MSNYLTICERAARAGGEVLLDWVGRFAIQEKGPRDLVTEADFASQQAIRQILLTEFPTHGFVGEEGDSLNPQAEYCWIADPLDGTTNYAHGLPHYAVSLALVQRGSPLVGVILDPVHDECFAAEQGQGSTLNGQPIQASRVQDMSQALIAANLSTKVDAKSAEVDQFIRALVACQSVRRTGSAALNLAYVAAGRLDGFWALSTKVWDIAAGILLVTEAGGVITSVDGSPLELSRPWPLATSTRELHSQFLAMLRENTG